MVSGRVESAVFYQYLGRRNANWGCCLRQGFFETWKASRLSDVDRIVCSDLQFPHIADLIVGCLALCKRADTPNVHKIGVALWRQVFALLEADPARFASPKGDVHRKKGVRRDTTKAMTVKTGQRWIHQDIRTRRGTRSNN